MNATPEVTTMTAGRTSADREPVATVRSAVRSSAEPSSDEPTAEALSMEALESELVGLAGHLAAGHCRWLRLLAEFDTREGWAGPGLRSCAHWLSWRVGMSLRTGFEQLRVAHALSALPAVTEAFAAGRISYSKVRAITRIASPATESDLLELALAGTATHVERVVRHTRQATADPVDAAQRELQWRWDDDGTLVLRGRFTAEQGSQLIAAITALTKAPGAPRTAEPAGSADAAGSARRRERSEHADATDVPGFAGGGAQAEFTESIADSSTVDGALDGDFARSAGHHDGHEASPIAARRADALVALAIGGGHRAAQLIVVVETGSPDTPGERTDSLTDNRVTPGSRAATASAHVHGGPTIPMRTAERIGCTARVRALLRDRRGNPLHLGRSRRLASPAQLTALHVRDHERCQFPGCEQTGHVEAHHIVAWLRGGRTDLDNLVLICGHHHRLIHDHGYRVRGCGTDLTFHRPDGRRIEPAGAPTGGSVEELLAGHVGARIDEDTITPTWAGERLDISGVLAALLPEHTSPAVA